MQNERNSLESFKMVRPADESEKSVLGTEIVGTRWLLHRKKATGKGKARLVAQQVQYCNDGLDTFAATATSVGARTLVALLADRNRRGGDWTPLFGDVKTAFLHASLPQGRRILLRPPSTEKDKLWVAQKALYGLRESPRRFQEHFSATVTKHGWNRLKTDPMLFLHESGAMMNVFADDLLLICKRKKLQETCRNIDKDLAI
eukprot:6025982-Heterocapsa_arctica.AAC.1